MERHSSSIGKDLSNCAFNHHQIPYQLLIQYFYKGLMPTDRSIIDTASGGALVDKTPEAARQLISNMAANSKQFGTRGDFPSK